MFFEVWFYLGEETNLHKSTVKADNAEDAAQFMRAVYLGFPIEIVKVVTL